MDVTQANGCGIEHILSWRDGDDKPRLIKDCHYKALPFEPDDFFGESTDIYKVLADLARANLIGDIYIALINPRECCVVKAQHISVDILYLLYSGHLNTPFLIFDNRRQFFILMDFDLPLQVIGYTNDFMNAGYDIESIINQGWQTVWQRYSNYINMLSIFAEYYHFIVGDKIKTPNPKIGRLTSTY